MVGISLHLVGLRKFEDEFYRCGKILLDSDKRHHALFHQMTVPPVVSVNHVPVLGNKGGLGQYAFWDTSRYLLVYQLVGLDLGGVYEASGKLNVQATQE